MKRITSKTNRIITTGVTAFAVVALAYSPAAFAATSNTTITGTIGSTITVSSGAAVSLDVAPDSSARYASRSNTVTVTTNNTTGYDLTLETTSAARELHKSTAPAADINAHTGTNAAPTALVANSWGYRVDNIGGFGAGPTAATAGVGGDVLDSTLWAGVPALNSPDTIATSTAPSAGGGDNVTVWYAMAADATKPSGNYTNTVLYTANVKP